MLAPVTTTDLAPTTRPASKVGPTDVRRLSGAAGAVADATVLHPAATDRLLRLVDEHAVVFVRRANLDEVELRALAGRLGTLTAHPVSGATLSTIVDSAEQPPAGFDWHTDLSWTTTPPALGFLTAEQIPAYGGDTIWASGTAMWERLGPALQRACATLQVRHRPDPTLLATVRRHHGDEVAADVARRFPGTTHPLVRRHPRTGRPVLWLSPLYADGVVGMDDRDARAMLDGLARRADDPEVQVRWRWEEGDLAIWDEAATCHRALTDHAPQRRAMRRCTTDGEAPVGYRTDRIG